MAVYGITFDTAKSELKPESTPALQEVAKLLGSDLGLKLWVVDHTDGVGAIDANMRLSQARAEAVVAALTTPGRARPAVARYFSSSTSRGGRAGNGACGSAWYQ